MSSKDPQPFLTQQARTRGFRLGIPTGFVVAPDDSRVVFLRSSTDTDPVNRLLVIDRTTGRERLVADPARLEDPEGDPGGDPDGDGLNSAERSRRERLRETTEGITDYSTDAAVTVAAFALGGRLAVADLTGDEPTRAGPARVLPIDGPVVDPRVDPTGRRVAWLNGPALWVARIDGTDARLLAGPDEAHSGEVTWGSAEFIAAEELDRHRGFWWAPDGESLLVARVDESPVERWWISDPTNPDRSPRAMRYPAAGTDNALVSLWLVQLDGSRVRVDWESLFPDAQYVASVRWTSRGPALITLLDRAQQTAVTVTVDRSGDCREVDRTTDPAWVEVTPGAPAWVAPGQLVTVKPDSASDTWRLFLNDRPLTPPDLQVRALLQVTDDGFLIAAGSDPTACQVCRIDPAGGVTPLTPAGSWASAARGRETLAVTETDIERVRPHTTWRRLAGGSTAGLGSVIAEIECRAATPLVTPRVDLLTLGRRELRAAVQWPADQVRRSGRLPVLLNPYGGPHAQRVVRAGRAFLASQWFADQGFCVLITDGRGSPGRGPAFERAIAGDLATAPLEDQVTALEQLAERHGDELDLDRVAIMGWSFGGYLAALAVLRRPDVFHAAIAGAPVTDWRLYDTAYTERYLGHPAASAVAYEQTSLLPLAPGLRRPLMIIHGLVDDNVFAAHSLRLSAALTAAGRPHEFLPLPGATHMTPQEEIARSLPRLQVDFLRRALALKPGFTG